MATTQPSPQMLREFVQNLLDDLTSGRVTPDAAMVASLQYPYLRALIGEHNDEIAGALQDEEKFRVVLEDMLRGASVAVNRELPQFQAEKPDQQLSPHDVVERARALRAARSEVVAITGQQQAKVGQIRETFINQLVQNWIAQTRTFIDREKQQQLAGAFRVELEQGLLDDLSPGEVIARVQRALKNTHVSEGVADTIRREVSPVRQELAAATQKLAGFSALPKELLTQLATPRPDRFATIAIQTISTTTLSPAAALARAASLAQIADAITPSLPKEKDVAAAGVFFRALASTPTQKAFAAAADALLNQLSPFARQEVIKATFSRALEGVLVKTDVLTKRLGQGFVESEFFRLAMDSTRKEFAQSAIEGGGVKRARGAIDDVIGSLLRGPIVEPLVGSPREAILTYFELLAIESRLPHDKKVLFPDHAPAIAALSLLASGQPEATRVEVMKSTGFAFSTAFQAAVSAFTQRLPSWRVFYFLTLLGRTGQDVVGAPGAASVGFLSFFGNVGLRAASGVGRVGLSLIEGLGGGFIGMMFGGGFGAIFNRLRGPRAPDRFFDDTPKLIAVVVVIVLVVLFVFPSFLNSTFTSRAAKHAALLVASVQINAGGPYNEVFPEYGGPFPDGPTTVASCAVDFKHQTQTPFDPGGIGTHKNTCAYDFDAPQHTPVRAVHGGYVAAVRFDIPDNKKIKGSYGNYVLVAGKTEGGQIFYSRYAHLAQSQPGALVVGSPINANTIIGEVDNTGNTTGPHLHLEFLNENQGYVTKSQCSSVFSLPAGCTQQ